MSQIDDINKDNQIADFADGKRTASSSDPEMVSLENTILSIKKNLPSEAPDSATTKQMLVRLKARIKREEEAPKVSIWKKLFDFQSNPQVGMILAVATILILAVVTIPSIQGDGAIIGTASSTNSILVVGGVIVVILLGYWLVRRK
jgi:hypothetical protein